MVSSIDKLGALSACSDIVEFSIPLVYVKNKTLMTLNASNRMHFHQRAGIKEVFKGNLKPILSKLSRFKSGHVHLILQVYFSDKRSRDLDNLIFVEKWLQDAMVDHLLLDDDKFISFTMLPAISEPTMTEHKVHVTAIDLNLNKYFEKLKEENEEQRPE